VAGQPGFFDGGKRLKALSAAGDPLERLAQVVDLRSDRTSRLLKKACRNCAL
jgi:hypothetical protein